MLQWNPPIMPSLKAMNLIEVENKSKSDPKKKPYTTVVDATGRLGCDCRGWTVLKAGKPRECVHLTGKKGLVETYHLKVETRGDYLYATNIDLQRGHVTPVTSAPTPPKAKPAPKAIVKPVVVSHGIKIIDIDEPDIYVDPMLASQMPDLPDQKVATVLKAVAKYSNLHWAIEEKFDGHRVIVAVLDGGVVKAWSRPKDGEEPIVRDLPQHILDVFATLSVGTYDGELIVPGGISTDVTAGENTHKLVFIVFDVLRLLGQDTTGENYDARRAYLVEIFKGRTSDAVKLAASATPSAAFVQAIFDRQGEGAIIKRRGATYQPGARSKDWLKIKGLETCIAEVTGFKKGKNGPQSTVLLRNVADGSPIVVKVKNNKMLAAFNKDPQSFIGRRALIEYQFRTRPTAKEPKGGYRHPRWDRWENE